MTSFWAKLQSNRNVVDTGKLAICLACTSITCFNAAITIHLAKHNVSLSTLAAAPPAAAAFAASPGRRPAGDLVVCTFALAIYTWQWQ